MVPEFDILRLDMAENRTSGRRIVESGKLIESVTVMTDPAAFNAAISFRPDGVKPLPLRQLGQEFTCVCGDEGIMLFNPPGAGTLELYIGYSSLQVRAG